MIFKKVLFSLFIILFCQVAYSQDSDQLAEYFGHIPDFSGIKISPDGDRIATLMNYNGQKILMIKSIIDQSIAPVGIPFNDGEFRWVNWVSNDRLIAGVRYAAQARYGLGYLSRFTTTRLVSMDWNGENQILLTKRNRKRNFQPQYQDNVIDMLRDDPEHVLLSLDKEIQNQPSVYKLNVKTNKRTLVHEDMHDIINWQTDYKQEVRLAWGEEYGSSKKETNLFVKYRKTAKDDWITLYQYNSQVAEPPYEFLGFTNEPNQIYIKQLNKSGFKGIYKMNVDTKEIVEVIAESDEYDIRGIMWGKDGELTGYTYRDHMFKRVNFDDKGQKINRIFEQNFPGTEFIISSESRDGQKIIVRTESSTDPGSYYLVDLTENKVELLNYNYKMLDAELLSDTKPIKFRASDGIEINGYLTLPKNAKIDEKYPTVILPLWRLERRFYQEFHYWPQFFAANGYAVLQVNYRGASGYGQYYQNLGKGELGRRVIQDVNEGTKWMIENGYSDPSKICLAGDTFGGYIALQAPISEPELYACSVAHAPITSLQSYLRFQRSRVSHDYVKSLLHNGEWDMDEASPLFNIDNLNNPVLLFHGEEDRIVLVKESRDYFKRMKKAKKEIQYFEFEDADAYLSREEHRVQFLKETGRFLKKYLN